jgi:predicted dienelactone hydrolase
MRRILTHYIPCTIAALLLVCSARYAGADNNPFHAGIVRVKASSDPASEVLVWYPTRTVEIPWRIGPFVIPAGRNADVAPGMFPIVLLSHGGGISGGSPLLLGDISGSLARQGFIVVAPFHGKAGLHDRSLQLRSALGAVLADPRFKPHADSARLGALGFSLGGAVALELAGAVPNAAHLVDYCGAHPDDAMSCGHAPDASDGSVAHSSPTAQIQAPASKARLNLKAIVLLDPFAVPYQKDELTAVTTPVIVFRPDRSELPGEANAIGLKSELPKLPQYEMVSGGHFIFADVCEPALVAAAPEVCGDPPGVERSAVHITVERQIGDFLHGHL